MHWKTYLNAVLGQLGLHGDQLAVLRLRVAIPLERLLQLLQLVAAAGMTGVSNSVLAIDG